MKPWQRTTVLAAALALCTVLAYLPSLDGGWVWDDHNLVERTPALVDLAGLRRAVSTNLYRQSTSRLEASPYWRPLAMATFWLDARLGEPPRSLHAGNVFLHALAAALLALLLLRRGGGAQSLPGLLAAAVAAAWWAFHPENVEAVAWISCRYDLLSGVALLCLVALPPSPRWGRSALHGLAFLAGLLSKDAFGAMVLVVAASDFAEGRGARAAAPRWVAVALALAAWWGARRAVGIRGMDLPPLQLVPGLFALYLDAARIYFVRAVLPAALTIGHPYEAGGALALAAGGAVLAVLVTAAVWRRRLAVPVAIFLAGLVPAALAMARFREVPERYLYLPSIGLALLVGELVSACLRAPRPALRPVAAAVVGLAAAAGVIRVEFRLPDWQGDDALFGAALRVNPDDPQGNMHAGIAAGRRRDWAEARRTLELAQRGDPRSGLIATNLAWALLESGDAAAAAQQARRATDIAPYMPDAWFLLAKSLHMIGDHAGELAAIDKILELSPDYPRARQGRAMAACEVSGQTDCLHRVP